MASNKTLGASKFKNINGVWLLKELFFETALNKDNVLYTLKEAEHNGYPSLYEAYMTHNDPTEYRFAIGELGGWNHWKALQECSWFKSYLDKWREELDIRFRSVALVNIVAASKAGKDVFAANKYLVEKGWDKTTNPKGRPTKEAIVNAAKQMAADDKRVSEDLERLTVN